MIIAKTYTTKLEQVSNDDSVIAILDAKLEATSPAQTVDYMGLALDNVSRKVAEAKQAIKAIQDIIKHEEAREEHIKEQCAEWLEGTGLDKLDGMIVSSVTINKTEPKQEVIITEAASVATKFWKSSIDKTAVKQALQNGEEVEGATLETTHVANKIKINKKRGAYWNYYFSHLYS